MRLRKEDQDERDGREERGEGDRWSEMQRVNLPEIDNKLVQKKFRIAMRFSQPGESGEKLLDWYHGNVTDILNKKKMILKIKCDEHFLHGDDMEFSTNVLLISRWNQKILVEGSWREHLTS